MSSQQSNTQQPDGSKLLLEMAPLFIFFILLKFKDIYWATGALMILTPITVFIEWRKTKKIPIMPLVSLVLILVFGGITLVTQNKAFIKMKPTFLYMLFAILLSGGLLFKKNFMKMLMGKQIQMSSKAWYQLTIRMALFFIGLAGLNELIWRNFSDGTWAIFKIIVMFLLIGFTMWQFYLLSPDMRAQFKQNSKND